MKQESIAFIRQHWRLLYHPNAGDFTVLFERSVLNSVQRIIDQLDHDEWRTISELAEGSNLGKDSIMQITSALNGELFEKFPCPELGRGREVAVKLLKPRARRNVNSSA